MTYGRYGRVEYRLIRVGYGRIDDRLIRVRYGRGDESLTSITRLRLLGRHCVDRSTNAVTGQSLEYGRVSICVMGYRIH